MKGFGMGIGTSRTRAIVGASLIGAGVLLSGCAQLVPPASANVDSRFGEALRQARAVQTMNPEASRNTDPVAGIDGESAQKAITVYRNSFREPPATFNVLNIGGSTLGAGGNP